MKDRGAHLTCYKIKNGPGEARFLGRSVNVANQFGTESLRLARPRTLCVPTTIEPCATVVSISGSGSPNCGGPELEPEPSPPFSGAIYDDPVAGNKIAALGLMCGYEGGGDSEYYPATSVSPGGVSVYGVGSCSADAMPLVGSAGSGPNDCTLGPSRRRVCGTQPQISCTRPADCPGNGACVQLPRCFAGLPLEVTGLVPACVLNVVSSDGSGILDRVTGDGAFGTPAFNYVYLTSGAQPCPRCVAGICNAGQRAGRACSAANAEGETYDCPPLNSQLLFALDLSAPPGSGVPAGTHTATAVAPDGLFCPGQRNPGAFGKPEARRIVEMGSPAGDLRDGMPHAFTLAGVPSIGSGGSLVDDFADLPGPNGMSLTGTVQLIE